jgi:hypothetical protein
VIDACYNGQSINDSEAMFLAGAAREFSMEKFISGMVTGGNNTPDFLKFLISILKS